MKTVSTKSWAPSLKRNKGSQNISDPLDIAGLLSIMRKGKLRMVNVIMPIFTPN